MNINTLPFPNPSEESADIIELVAIDQLRDFVDEGVEFWAKSVTEKLQAVDCNVVAKELKRVVKMILDLLNENLNVAITENAQEVGQCFVDIFNNNKNFLEREEIGQLALLFQEYLVFDLWNNLLNERFINQLENENFSFEDQINLLLSRPGILSYKNLRGIASHVKKCVLAFEDLLRGIYGVKFYETLRDLEEYQSLWGAAAKIFKFLQDRIIPEQNTRDFFSGAQNLAGENVYFSLSDGMKLLQIDYWPEQITPFQSDGQYEEFYQRFKLEEQLVREIRQRRFNQEIIKKRFVEEYGNSEIEAVLREIFVHMDTARNGWENLEKEKIFDPLEKKFNQLLSSDVTIDETIDELYLLLFRFYLWSFARNWLAIFPCKRGKQIKLENNSFAFLNFKVVRNFIKKKIFKNPKKLQNTVLDFRLMSCWSNIKFLESLCCENGKAKELTQDRLYVKGEDFLAFLLENCQEAKGFFDA